MASSQEKTSVLATMNGAGSILSKLSDVPGDIRGFNDTRGAVRNRSKPRTFGFAQHSSMSASGKS